MSIFLAVLILSLEACNQLQKRQFIRGYYKNVLEFPEGAVISTRKVNGFDLGISGFDNGIMFRDSIYYITGNSGFTYCYPGYSIEIILLQPFELNTFVFWLWDANPARTYNIQVYVKYGNSETIILDTTATKSIVSINFPDQLVDSFRIYNRGGNTENTGVYIIKTEAYYKFG